MTGGCLTVLIVDDDKSLRESLALNLECEGYSVSTVADGEEGIAALLAEEFDIILCDLKMPNMDGLSFIEKCRKINSESAIILMTAFGDRELAIKAMRLGAYDYIAKPFSVDALIFTLQKVQERERLKAENLELRSAIARRYRFSNIIAQSDAMLSIFETIKRMSEFKTTVLITGESGTGKELLAKAIHYNSTRRKKPFIAINCGAIPDNLIESELFGHRKGSFTDATRDKKGLFEEASGGTVFLDEIGELSSHLQVKLLRVLQEQTIRPVGDETTREIDVRVVAATHRDIEREVEEGRFREDLYYRLNVVTLHIPPLRERPEDIPILVEHFISKHNKQLGLKVGGIKDNALKCLLTYQWRGNVRELENCVERAMVLSEKEYIEIGALPRHIRERRGDDEADYVKTEVADDDLSIKKRMKNLEIDLIMRALKQTKGNRTHAAKLLEISHRTLLYKLKEYGLQEVEKG